MRGCINSGLCNCHCPNKCGKDHHCNQHSNGCHLECPSIEDKEERDDYRLPRERDGLGRFKKR